MLGVGDQIGEPLRSLFSSVSEEDLVAEIRQVYAALGSRITDQLESRKREIVFRQRSDEVADLQRCLEEALNKVAQLEGAAGSGFQQLAVEGATQPALTRMSEDLALLEKGLAPAPGGGIASSGDAGQADLGEEQARITQLQLAAQSALQQRSEEADRLKEDLAEGRARLTGSEDARKILFLRSEEIARLNGLLVSARARISQLEGAQRALHLRSEEVTRLATDVAKNSSSYCQRR